MEKDKQNSQSQSINDLPELSYSDWFTINSFARSFNLTGSNEDANAQEWYETISGILSIEDKIEGAWYSRWNRKDSGNKWACGIAHMTRLGSRVYILHKDPGNIYLIEAQCQDEKLLIGKYTNLGNRLDSTPWVGLIVSPDRIDGQWPQGRWDLRRKNI